MLPESSPPNHANKLEILKTLQYLRSQESDETGKRLYRSIVASVVAMSTGFVNPLVGAIFLVEVGRQGYLSLKHMKRSMTLSDEITPLLKK